MTIISHIRSFPGQTGLIVPCILLYSGRPGLVCQVTELVTPGQLPPWNSVDLDRTISVIWLIIGVQSDGFLGFLLNV